MQSARQNPQVVEEYLAKEVKERQVIGPLNPVEYPDVQVSSFGVIPKSHQPGKWRLIVDLSSPEGQSVNDSIAKSLWSLSYISVDDIASVVLHLGRGALLAKMDVQSAYCNVPVHPDDRILLEMQWESVTPMIISDPKAFPHPPQEVFHKLPIWVISQSSLPLTHLQWRIDLC